MSKAEGRARSVRSLRFALYSGWTVTDSTLIYVWELTREWPQRSMGSGTELIFLLDLRFKESCARSFGLPIHPSGADPSHDTTISQAPISRVRALQLNFEPRSKLPTADSLERMGYSMSEKSHPIIEIRISRKPPGRTAPISREY